MKEDGKFGFNVRISSLSVTISLLNLLVEEESPERATYLHYHAGFEIHGMTQGECTLRIDGADKLVREGELCLIPPGAYHVQKHCSKPFSKYSLGFELDGPPDDAHDAEGWSVYGVLQAFRYARPVVLSCPRLHRLLEDMREAAGGQGRPLAPRSTLHMLTALCILEAARCLSGRLASGNRLSAVSPGAQTRGALIDDFFSRNFNLRNGADLLASRLSVSRRQLDRVLHKAYGRSFREKLMEARLEVALDFLRTSDKSVAEISELLGYSTPANFSTFIKHQTGKSPTQLRKMP